MKIIVIGTRGIPDILGGVETHCQELYPRIDNLGDHEITIVTRKPYVKNLDLKSFKNLKLKHIYAPQKKSFEAIVHTFLAVLYAAYKRPDVLHIHAIGPMLMTPLARLLGLKVVVTHHGPDYDRQKWGRLAKKILRLGEFMGAHFAHRIIVISRVISKIIADKHHRQDTELIYNGVVIPKPASQTDYIESLGLTRGQYMIGVGRFVEEKGFDDLIAAYTALKTDVQLVLVGDADHETTYSKQLKAKAKQHNVVLTGFIKGEALHQIFSHAGLFVMPSYHEGLPIALLEAMSYNLPVLVSDIPANTEVPLDKDCYFITGDIEHLRRQLEQKLQTESTGHSYKNLLETTYNWDKIAQQTLEVYQSL